MKMLKATSLTGKQVSTESSNVIGEEERARLGVGWICVRAQCDSNWDKLINVKRKKTESVR